MAIVNLEACPDFSIVRQMQLIFAVLNEMEESIGPLWMVAESDQNPAGAWCLGNITGNEHGLGNLLAQSPHKTAEPPMIEAFQVNICRPDRALGSADSVLNFLQYSIVAHQLAGEKGYPLKGRMPTASRLQ